MSKVHPNVPNGKYVDKKVAGIHSPNIETRLMSLAIQVSFLSRDPFEQSGAVLTNRTDDVISVGFNGKLEGIYQDKELSYAEEDKKLWMNDACIAAVGKLPINHEFPSYKMYTTCFPSLEAMRRLVEERVLVITYGPLMPRWYTERQGEEVRSLAKIGGITLTRFDGNLNWARDKWESYSKLL